jgi:hypothetical protein
MAAAGQTVEGVPAARLARELASSLRPDPDGPGPADGRAGPTAGLPLLAAVNHVLDGAPDPAAVLAAAVLPG